MSKTVVIKFSDEEHEKFISACKRAGKFRQFFAKSAVLIEAERVNLDFNKNNQEEK